MLRICRAIKQNVDYPGRGARAHAREEHAVTMNPTKCLNISGTVHNFSLLSWLNRVRFNIMNYEYCVRESTIAAYNVIVQQPYFISLQRKNAVEERKNGRERGRIKRAC